MKRACLVLFTSLLGCGPGAVGADEVGDAQTESGSSESGPTTSDSDSSGTSDPSGSTDSGESETGSTGTTDSGESETGASDSTDSGETDSGETDTGERDPECSFELDDLWSLSCGSECAGLPGLWSKGVVPHAEGSQISDDGMDCGLYSFEGRVLDHPSPDVWIIDACPCDLDCLEQDPQLIDFAYGTEHPAPELLPSELGECVRVDVWKSNTFVPGTHCGPTAIALWSLDTPEPTLLYAQGAGVLPGYNQLAELNSLVVSHGTPGCQGSSGVFYWTHYSTQFALDDVSVVVPHQSLDVLVHPSGDYEARNIVNVHQGYDGSSGRSDFRMWSVRPLL